MKLRSFVSGILLFALVLLTPALLAQDGMRGAFSRDEVSPVLLRNPFGQNLIAADFDSDLKPDGAVLLEGGQLDGERAFRIELHVTSGIDHQLTFASAETALSISAGDVNQDGTPDLVVEQAFTRQRLHVWLNDGHGLFREIGNGEYPFQLPASTHCQGWTAGPDCVVLSLTARPGTESAALKSARISVEGNPARGNSRPVVVLVHSGSRTPDRLRGPPFYFSF